MARKIHDKRLVKGMKLCYTSHAVSEGERLIHVAYALKEGFNVKSGDSLRQRKRPEEGALFSDPVAEGCVFRSFLYA